MKRAFRFIIDLVLGGILGYIAGLLAYVVLFAVLAAVSGDRKQAQATAFMIGMAVVPLVIAIKIWRGQRAFGIPRPEPAPERI